MKLSKTSWMILGIGIFVIAFASLGVARYRQLEEQNSINEEQAVAERRLSALQLEPLLLQQKELEERMKQAATELENTRERLSVSINSIVTSETLFDFADNTSTRIVDISSSIPTNGSLEGLTVSILPLNITVEGDLASLIQFIARLNNDFSTGSVSSVNITTPEETGEKSTAKIRLLLHTYQGG